MKRFKFLVSMTLVIAMLCSMLSLGVQAAFTDVPYNHECLDGNSILMKKDGNVIVEGEGFEYTVIGNVGEYGLNIDTIGTANEGTPYQG